MKDQILLRIISYYCLIIGAVNIIMWVFIITSGTITDFEEKSTQYAFHWLSEFTTAILLIVAGIKLHRDKENLNFLFLALGFLITAVGGAFIYYLANFEVPMFIITTLISGATIVILILIYKSLDELLFFTNGIALYSLLNIIGKALQVNDISLISMSVPAFIFILIITMNLINKNVVFRYMFHHEVKNLENTGDNTNRKETGNDTSTT